MPYTITLSILGIQMRTRISEIFFIHYIGSDFCKYSNKDNRRVAISKIIVSESLDTDYRLTSMLSVGSARIKYFESHFRLRLLAAADMAGQFLSSSWSFSAEEITFNTGTVLSHLCYCPLYRLLQCSCYTNNVKIGVSGS